MNVRTFSRAVAALLLVVTLGPAVAAGDQAPDAIARFGPEHVRGMIDGSVEPLVGRSLTELRLMPPYHGTIFGKADATHYYRAFLERFDVQAYDRATVRTYELGTRVVEVGSFRMRLLLRRTNAAHELAGHYMDVWERAADGGVTLATQAWNYDRYPPIESELRFVEVPGVRVALQAHVPVKDSLSFELAALNKLHEAAVAEHDASLWAQFFAPDALLLANLGGRADGAEAIGKYVTEHARQLPVFEKLDIRNDRIDPAGRYVIEYASHIAMWRAGEHSGVSTGKDIRLWRREADGALKIIGQIGSYD